MGGQPGHAFHQRALVPIEKVDTVVTCKPDQCRRCGGHLTGSDSEPIRQQVVELPPVRPQLTEYQLHRLRCPGCGITTCGELPAGILPTCYGPRLASVVALCTGAYRMSKRMAASFCREVLEAIREITSYKSGSWKFLTGRNAAIFVEFDS